MAPVAPVGGAGGVWPPTAFHGVELQVDFNREELEGHLRQSRRDLALDSTVGLEEALASDWETGEEPAVEKLPPDPLLRTGLERRRGLGIAGRRIARASPVFATGNSLDSLSGSSLWSQCSTD